MNLQHHARLHSAIGQFAIERDHSQFDQVGGSALQRRVNCSTFRKSSGIRIAARNIRNRANAAEECAYSAIASRIFKCLLNESLHTLIASEVAFDVSLGLGL